MELWLPWLGSWLPTRGGRQATLERGFWLTRLMGATAQRSLDRFGLALLPGDGRARHSFIALDDVADSLAAATGEATGEVHLGGPETLSWLDAARVYGRVLGKPIRAVRQPTASFRALAAAARPLSPAASQLLAAGALVATVDTAYPPDDARRLLGRDPISVESFLHRAVQIAS
jgi:uncharacterized protein YbjT (DUF2867 family)